MTAVDFCIYEKNGNGLDLLASLQQVITKTGLSGVSVRVVSDNIKKGDHDFELTPALFIGDHLLLEGDSPSSDELDTLITVAARLYCSDTGTEEGCSGSSSGFEDYDSDGCCGGNSCGCS